MNAHTFDPLSPTCPICHRADAIKPHRLLRGLLICQYCRERLVVSWSGHYVRDPFAFKHLMTGQWLRQQSHPLARIRRDFKTASNPILLVVLSSVVFLGTALVLLQGSPSEQSRPNQLPSSTTEIK
ncbi:MAG: hypothetical protein K6T90_01135 [Leptolyngbyaceae cyanobacterium HOT.MB2.61]|jgi:hypothetical protein|nr:hypothetical protein [Leptolyngbyaceae cyanobacterium HOT.MB2.61]